MSVWLQRPPGDLSAYEVDTDQPGHDTEDGGDPHDDGDVDQQAERPSYHVRNFKRSLEPDDREVDGGKVFEDVFHPLTFLNLDVELQGHLNLNISFRTQDDGNISFYCLMLPRVGWRCGAQ